MKTLHTFYFLLFIFFTVSAQQSNDITIGKIDSISSTILNEQRKIWLHIPDEGGSAKKKYPVVYLLDGDFHFYAVVGMIHHLSALNICPKMIVVGIPNTNRTRDLTPTKGKFDPPFADSTTVANSGGGKNFISFIEKELIPYIDSNYPTDSYRMFVGHSFGGLTVMNTLIEKPELFNSYVAIDPSMWWDNNKLLNKIKETQLDGKYRNKKLFLAIANTMREGMDTLNVQKDTTRMTKSIRANLDLNTLLKKDTQKHLLYKGKYYEKEDHGSVPLVAEYDALRFIFDFFQLKLDIQDDFLNRDSDILAKVENHYLRLSKEFGRAYKPDEAFINELGYLFMIRLKQFDRAEQFFKLNVKNYPESFNAYDSLGDLYSTIGKKEKAIENYNKSISLNKDSSSKEKLKELEKE